MAAVEVEHRLVAMASPGGYVSLQEDDWLPSWAYDSETKDLTREYQTAGPAVQWAFLSTAVLWGSFVAFPFVVYFSSQCEQTGYAPPHVAVTMCYYPIVFATLFIEWKCLRYLVRPQFLTYKCFKMMGQPVPFVAWAGINFFISFLSHMDIFSANLVYASLIKAVMSDCQEADGEHLSVGGIWSETIDQSAVWFIPGLRNLGLVLLAGWLLMLLQGMWLLVRTLPLDPLPWQLDYSVRTSLQIFKYKTTALQDISFRTAMKQLADLNRMATVVANDLTNIKTVMATPQWKADAQLVELRRVVWKFFWRSVLENSFFLNVQVSAWMITKAMSEGKSADNWLILASLVFKFPPTVIPLYFESMKVYEIWKLLNRDPVPPEAVAASRYALGYVGLVFLYVFVNGYAAVKLAMSFVCPDSMWNVTGCVSFS